MDGSLASSSSSGSLKDSQPAGNQEQRKWRLKISADEKVEQVFNLLRKELNWSLIDFFRALYSNPWHYRYRLAFEEAAY